MTLSQQSDEWGLNKTTIVRANDTARKSRNTTRCPAISGRMMFRLF